MNRREALQGLAAWLVAPVAWPLLRSRPEPPNPPTWSETWWRQKGTISSATTTFVRMEDITADWSWTGG